MKPEHKAVLKTAGTFGLLGAGLLAVVGNPVAWAALAYSTYRIGKTTYAKEKQRVTMRQADEDLDLFV